MAAKVLKCLAKQSICVLAFISLVACSSSNRFDLQCRLVQYIASAKYPDKAFDMRARLDLTNKRWCEGDCKQLRSLAVTEEELVLDDHDSTDNIEGEITIHHRWHTAVNRRTGVFSSADFSHTGPGDITEGTDTMATVTGPCGKEPFTGFLTKRF